MTEFHQQQQLPRVPGDSSWDSVGPTRPPTRGSKWEDGDKQEELLERGGQNRVLWVLGCCGQRTEASSCPGPSHTVSRGPVLAAHVNNLCFLFK